MILYIHHPVIVAALSLGPSREIGIEVTLIQCKQKLSYYLSYSGMKFLPSGKYLN